MPVKIDFDAKPFGFKAVNEHLAVLKQKASLAIALMTGRANRRWATGERV